MRMRFVPMILLVLGLAVAAQAQTTTKLAFDVGGATLTEVNAYTKTISVDGVALAGTTTCVTAGPDVTCTVDAPTLTVGTTHTIEIKLSSGGYDVIYQFTGIDPAKAPKGIKGAVKISTRIVINVGN